MQKLQRIFLFFLLLLLGFTISAKQTDTKNEQDFKYAVKLEKEGKLNDALAVLKLLLKADSSNSNYLEHASILYSQIGYSQDTEEIKLQWYKTADYLSQKAISINSNSAGAHYAYAMAIGLQTEKAPMKVKVSNAKLIKVEAEKAIALNPNLPGPYHILARWHRVIAGFNSFERGMISFIFGSMPGGSYEDAIYNFDKAIALEPYNSIHYYELALTYVERDSSGDEQKAINNLNKVLKLPVKNKGEAGTKKLSEELLGKLK